MTDEEYKKWREEYDNREPMPFREFLDKSSGTLTVFAILNGLAVFSTTLKDQSEIISYSLSFSFWLMSIIVWFEFFSFAGQASGTFKKSFAIGTLEVVSLLVLFMFAAFLFKVYPGAVQFTIGILIGIGTFSLTFWALFKLIPKQVIVYFFKRYSKKLQVIPAFIMMLISFAVAVSFSYFVTPYVFDFFKQIAEN